MVVQLQVLQKNFEGLENRKTIAADIATIIEPKQASLRAKDGVSDSRAQKAITRSARFALSTKDLVMSLARLDAHGIAPFVLGGIYTVVQVVQNDSDEHCAALSLTLDIAATVALWHSVEQYQIDQNVNPKLKSSYDELGNAIVELYQRIIVLLGTMMGYFDKDRWAQILSAVIQAHLDWTKMQTEIKVIEGKCDKIKSRINAEKDNESRNSAILKRISSHDIRGSYQTVLERTDMDDRYKTRCQWLVDSDEFQNWRTEGSNSVLWLNGTIGTGKTTLMARAISQMKDSVSIDGKALPLAMFFFKKATDPKDKLNTQTCLQSLARQLSWNPATAQVAPSATQKYEELKVTHNEDSQMTIGESISLLEGLILEREAFIMIDGIDECKDSTGLLHQLALLRRKTIKPGDTNAPLHIMIAGRSDLPVTDCFGDGISIVTNNARSHDDQEFHIDSEIDTLCQNQAGSLFCSPDRDHPSRLKDVLKRKASGLFRWIEIQIQKFSTPGYFGTHGQINDELERLEEHASGDELRTEYARLLSRLQDYHKNCERAMKLLRLIACSFDDLTAIDLAEAINASELDAGGEEVTDGDFRRILVGFVTETYFTSWYYKDESPQRVVEFAHASVLEYLVDSNIPSETFTIASQHHEAVMISFSRIRAIEKHLSSPIYTITANKTTRFLLYCCYEWPRHCRVLFNECADNVVVCLDAVRDFIIDGGYQAWNDLLNLDPDEKFDLSQDISLNLDPDPQWENMSGCLTNHTPATPGFLIVQYDLT